MKIIRLRVIDFDNEENLISVAEHISWEKYFKTLAAANAHIATIDRKRYDAWNGHSYPKITLDEIEVLE